MMHCDPRQRGLAVCGVGVGVLDVCVLADRMLDHGVSGRVRNPDARELRTKFC
jgi:hypothetical protein